MSLSAQYDAPPKRDARDRRSPVCPDERKGSNTLGGYNFRRAERKGRSSVDRVQMNAG